MLDHDYACMIGRTNIAMADGGHNAAIIYRRLASPFSPLEYRAFLRYPFPRERLKVQRRAEVPPVPFSCCGCPA